MTTTTPSNEVAGQDGVPHLTRRDYISTYIRSTFMLGSFNFERMQAIGVCVTMMPAIRRFYTKKEDQAAALTRHLEFYNTHPWVSSVVFGVTAAMEEQKAKGEEISEETITSVKVGLMGPLAGVGDPIFWGTARPVFAALGAGIAQSGSLLGPILFFVLFNAVRLFVRYWGIQYGYKKGLEIVSDMGGGALQKITEAASILGLFVMGALVNKWTHINIPYVISEITTRDGAVVTTQTTTVQNVLDNLMPGLPALGMTFLCMYLLRKGVNALWLIFGIFGIGILGYWLKILA